MSFYKEVPGRKTTLESTLKFDTTPTAGSTNPVTSGGVASAIDSVVPQNSYTALAGNTALPLNVDANGKLTNNGLNLTVTGTSAWAEGRATKATALASHAEGRNSEASKDDAHAEGYETKASGFQSHAEGYISTASGNRAHAEGSVTTASGQNAHSEGDHCTASGTNAHAGGNYSTAGGSNSFVHGDKLATTKSNNAWFGQFNADEDAFFGVGNGTADDARKNALKVDKNGHLWANADSKLIDFTLTMDNTDSGNELTETPPQAEYTVGNYYFIVGQLCKCTAYSASSATFKITSLLDALNSLNT